MPQVAQLEDPTTLTSNYIRVFGTNPATLTISNAGVPTKLAEMQVPITRTASAALGTSTLTMTDTTNLQPGMFVVGAGIANGTVILSVDSLTAITISNATTGTLSSTTLTFSYTGTFGLNALLAATGSAVSTSNPTWINWSSLAGSTTSVTTSVTTSSSGFQGIPYQPGQTYTLSCYISASVDVQASTPLLFQLRSTGATYGAATGTSYNTGNTNSGTTSSIDAGQANGFFVRQQTPAMMTNYGGTVNQVGTAANGSTTLTLVDATGVYASMAVTGTGIANGTTISSITGTTVTLSAATTAAITAGTITFSAPTGVQIIGSNKTPGQTGWRRISATFANNPALATVTALGVYGYGSTPQFIYPTIVLQQQTSTLTTFS
jgi:hypothetical protein